jgi:type IV secretion system protein VirB10
MPEEKPVPETPSSTSAPTVRDTRKLPEGVVPKQAQGYVIAGLAVLILMAVMFSKNHAKPSTKEAPSLPMAVSNDMNQRKIRELEQDLSADQKQSQQAQKAATSAATSTTSAANAVQPTSSVSAPTVQMPPATDPPRDPVKDAERELAFKSRFASNLVSGDARQPVEQSDSANAAEPRSLPKPEQAYASQPVPAATKRTPEVSVNAAHGQPYVVFEGTTIDTVLANRLDGEFAGPVKVMVMNPVYSQDRQHLLIPEGTFILGDVQKVAGPGQKRLAVTFHRLIMPDGYSVDLDQFHGLDQIGDTGLKDQVNNHYLQIFGTSIALGVVAGAAQATNSTSGLNESGSEAYRSGIASSLSQSSANVLDRFINIPPTITIREGHRIKVYITQDMLLPGYENHTVTYYSTPVPGMGYSFSDLITQEALSLSGQIESDQTQQIADTVTNAEQQLGSPPGSFNILEDLTFLVIALLLAAMQAVAFAVIAYGYVASAVCVLIGPIFIPFFIVPKLDWLFWGWFKAFIGFSFYQVVASAFIFVFAKVLTSMLQTIGTISISNAFTILPALFITLFVCIFGLVKIPELTASILGGRTGTWVNLMGN